jgi:hypothetical protein
MNSRFRHLVYRGRLGQPTVEHEHLAEYLLRRLPDEESARIAERLFDEESFSTELEEVERDLLDAYVRKKLSAGERAEVDRFLLTSESQREKLRFALALAAGSQARRSGESVYWLAAAGILVTSMAGFVSWQNRGLRIEIAALRLKEAQTTVGRPVNGQAVSFLLAPVERGADAEVLTADPAAKLIRLDFSLGNGNMEFAAVRVVRGSGELVLQQNAVHTQSIGGSVFVSVWLPGGTLVPGSYSATAGQKDFAFRMTDSTSPVP